MVPKVERITDIPILKVGEGPHWDVDTQSLYFVDIPNKSIHRYVPSTGQHTSATLQKRVSIIIPVKDKPNQFVIGSEKEVNIIKWDGNSKVVTQIEKIAEPGHANDSGLNDGKVDPKGRLWIGSCGNQLQKEPVIVEGTGCLFSIEKGKLSTHLTGVKASNGLTWNSEIKQFYYADSLKKTVDAFDYDVEKGTIANRREIFTVSKYYNKGLQVPDGITIDKDGNLWVAVFGSRDVLKIDPRKPETLLQTVEIPTNAVTSLAWGGKNLDVLYVTSADPLLNGLELPPGDNGGVFRVSGLGTSGLPMNSFEL